MTFDRSKPKKKLGYYDIPHVRIQHPKWPKGKVVITGRPIKKRPKRKVYQPTDKLSHQRANKLHARLKKAKMLMEVYQENKWAQDFAKLAARLAKAEVPVTSEELDATLDWYCKHLRKGIPLCSSVSSFKRWFYDIYNLKIKDEGPMVKITASEKLQKKVLKLWLPGAKEEDVLKTMQLSINNYTAFYQTAQKLLAKFEKIKENSKDEKWLFFALKLRQKKVYGIPILWPDTERFVYDWFDFYIQEKLGNWDKWDGNVLRHVWHPEHKWFAADMRAWAAKHTRSERLWDDFVQMVKDENQTSL